MRQMRNQTNFNLKVFAVHCIEQCAAVNSRPNSESKLQENQK